VGAGTKIQLLALVCSVMAQLSGTPEHLSLKEQIWETMDQINPEATDRLRPDTSPSPPRSHPTPSWRVGRGGGAGPPSRSPRAPPLLRVPLCAGVASIRVGAKVLGGVADRPHGGELRPPPPPAPRPPPPPRRRIRRPAHRDPQVRRGESGPRIPHPGGAQHAMTRDERCGGGRALPGVAYKRDAATLAELGTAKYAGEGWGAPARPPRGWGGGGGGRP